MNILAALFVVLLSAPVFAQSKWINHTFEGGTYPNLIYSICENIDGTIWIGTSESIQVFDGSQWSSINQINGQSDLNVVHIANSMNGDIWATLNDIGIVKYSNSELTLIQETQGIKYNALAVDSKGGVWVGHSYEKTSREVRHYNGQSWTEYSELCGFKYLIVLDIVTSDLGDIWVSTNEGLFKTHVDSLDSWSHYSDQNVLLNKSMYEIKMGPTGDLWTSSGYGISHFNGESWSYITQISSFDDIGAFTEFIEVDNTNRLWLMHGIYNLCSFSDGTWDLNQYTYEEMTLGVFPEFRIQFIDSQNRMWLGTDNGVYYHQLSPVTIVEKDADTPVTFTLSPPSPNPFNPVTTISYTLTKSSPVTLAVYNISGQKVATLVDERQAAGMHTATFDGTGLASGLYFARIEVGGMIQTEKMVLMK